MKLPKCCGNNAFTYDLSKVDTGLQKFFINPSGIYLIEKLDYRLFRFQMIFMLHKTPLENVLIRGDWKQIRQGLRLHRISLRCVIDRMKRVDNLSEERQNVDHPNLKNLEWFNKRENRVA